MKQEKFVGTPTYDPLRVGVSMAVKLGSIAVHAEELISPHAHQYDVAALRSLLEDAEVKQWLEAMGKMAFLPVKRVAEPAPAPQKEYEVDSTGNWYHGTAPQKEKP